MKKVLLPLLAATFLISCNANESTTVKGATDSSGKTETVSLPFPVTRTPDWEIGDPANVPIAMNALKAFVDNDMTRIKEYLADSVDFRADDFTFKGHKDSLVKSMTEMRNQYDKIDISMKDYESVKSKNRGEEWVSMWYVQTNFAKDGKIDSAMYMDDIQIVNGKVALIDSKGRRLANK